MIGIIANSFPKSSLETPDTVTSRVQSGGHRGTWTGLTCQRPYVVLFLFSGVILRKVCLFFFFGEILDIVIGKNLNIGWSIAWRRQTVCWLFMNRARTLLYQIVGLSVSFLNRLRKLSPVLCNIVILKSNFKGNLAKRHSSTILYVFFMS